MRIPFRVRSDRSLVVLRIHVDYETEKKPPPEAVVRIRRADIGEDGLYFLQQRRRSNAPLACIIHESRKPTRFRAHIARSARRTTR